MRKVIWLFIWLLTVFLAFGCKTRDDTNKNKLGTSSEVQSSGGSATKTPTKIFLVTGVQLGLLPFWDTVPRSKFANLQEDMQVFERRNTPVDQLRENPDQPNEPTRAPAADSISVQKIPSHPEQVQVGTGQNALTLEAVSTLEDVHFDFSEADQSITVLEKRLLAKTLHSKTPVKLRSSMAKTMPFSGLATTRLMQFPRRRPPLINPLASLQMA